MARQNSMIKTALVALLLGLVLVCAPAHAAQKAVSPAVSSLITDYYVTILGRQPDSSGQAFSKFSRQAIKVGS